MRQSESLFLWNKKKKEDVFSFGLEAAAAASAAASTAAAGKSEQKSSVCWTGSSTAMAHLLLDLVTRTTVYVCACEHCVSRAC